MTGNTEVTMIKPHVNVFASSASREESRKTLGPYWDEEEDYPLVGDLDAMLHDAALGATFWRHTAPCHWMVLAEKAVKP